MCYNVHVCSLVGVARMSVVVCTPETPCCLLRLLPGPFPAALCWCLNPVICCFISGGAFVAGDALMYTGCFAYWMVYLAMQVGKRQRGPANT